MTVRSTKAMTARRPIIAGHFGDNVAVAQRLQGFAIDSLYTVRPGTRPVTISPISDDLDIIACLAEQPWGISAHLCARDSHGSIHAAAEAGVISSPSGQAIQSRITLFRTGPLLWTYLGAALDLQPIAGPPQRYRATAVDQHYHLHREYDRRHQTVWILTTPSADATEPIRFAGLRGAAAYVTQITSAAR
jgi:hypothetical protein